MAESGGIMDFYNILAAKKFAGGGGVTPTGTLDISVNGTYDVTQYAEASVNVPTGGGDDVLISLINRSIGSINIPSGVTMIGKSAFRDCESLLSVSIPESVTNIGDFAFGGCDRLSEINLPSGLTGISNFLFVSCSRLANIKIPNGVTTIGEQAFSGCTTLNRLVFPSGVTAIGRNAFANAGFTEVTFKSTTPPTIDKYTIKNFQTYTVIYVPAESVEAYKTADNWSDKASQIQAIPA